MLGRTIALVMSTPSTPSSQASVLQLLHRERAVLDDLQRRAPSLTATEVLMRLAACRHRIEDINRRLP